MPVGDRQYLDPICKLNGVEPLGYLTDVLQRSLSGRTKNHELHATPAVELASTILLRCRIITATTAYPAAASSCHQSPQCYRHAGYVETALRTLK
jgi:hypothetical protein